MNVPLWSQTESYDTMTQEGFNLPIHSITTMYFSAVHFAEKVYKTRHQPKYVQRKIVNIS